MHDTFCRLVGEMLHSRLSTPQGASAAMLYQEMMSNQHLSYGKERHQPIMGLIFVSCLPVCTLHTYYIHPRPGVCH